MAEQDFFQERWREQMKAFASAYRSMQKPKWKLGDIAAEVDKGSRKAFWGRLYDDGRVDITHAEFDHYIQTAIAYPPEKRVMTKSWSLHFKLRNLPDRWDLVRKDEMKRTADADAEIKRRKQIAQDEEDAEQAAERRNEEPELSFYEVWDSFIATAEEALKNWLANNSNWEVDLEHVLKMRRDSNLFIDAWKEAIEGEIETVLDLQQAFNDAYHREKVPF